MSQYNSRFGPIDWKSMPNGPEKYQAYLASREWAALKEAVRARSGGTCEYCRRAPGTQTHHMTYIRKYCELLSDLLHVCAPCHLYLSKKSDYDPRSVRENYVIWDGQKIRNVYLAGKITGTTWRDEIAPGWSHHNHSEFPYFDGFENDDYDSKFWGIARSCIPVGEHSLLDMTGPFWMDLGGGGHGTVYINQGPHANGLFCQHGTDITDLDLVRDRIVHAIYVSELVFAWIDSADCFGTLFEIGLACMRCPLVIACPPGFIYLNPDLWLSIQSADQTVEADTPGEAWRILWARQAMMRGDAA